ncbi:hypothetical protein MBLNU230_g8396t1 [Neophaeotheca triangularis]
MLSAFKAQPIHELKTRDKSKIESLLTYGDRLLVGLNTGSLRIYRVNEPTADEAEEAGDGDQAAPKNKTVELMREEEKFSRRPVQQLAIVKEANLLVSLSDNYVSLHDLQTYQLVERLERTKGASCFAVASNVIKDPETHVPTLISRLAVGVKRKLTCWTWQDMELHPDAAEISLEATVKSLNWVTGSKLVVGMDAGFSVVDVETQETTAVNKTASHTAADANSGELAGVRFAAVSSTGMGYMGMGSWVPKPMATRLSENEVLLAKDVNTLFADTDGNPLEKRQIPWSQAPEAVGYSYPYLLALQTPDKGSLQIRNPDTLSLLQTISLPSAVTLHVPQPNISLAHAGKGFLVASDRTIWRMNALPYHSQLSELVEKQRFDEALSLLKLLEDTLIDDKEGRIRELTILKATYLFQQQKYRPALDLFTDAQTPPERVVALYPRSIAGDLSTVIETSDQSEAEPTTENGEPKAEEVAKEAQTTPSKGIMKRFTASHKRTDSDLASIKSSARADADNMSIRNKAPTKNPDKPLEGDDLKFAVRALCSFLAQARVQIQRYLNTDGALKENPPSLGAETGKPPFATLLPQSVFDVEDLKQIDWQSELLKTAGLVDTTLFRAYMLASPSLAGPLFRLDNFCDPQVVQSSLFENERYNDMIDFLHGKKLHRQALEMLAKFGRGETEHVVPDGMEGPERTVGYLKQLPPDLIDVVLEFVKWPLEEKPEVGMDVFLADTYNAEQMPRDRVLEFLAEFDKQLEAQYLEHIINELGDSTREYHQQLVDIYLTHIKDDDLTSQAKITAKEKLETFLRTSAQYEKAKTLRQLPPTDATFHESRAIVLSAIGNHKQALAIYAFQIDDPQKAEDYCNRTYLSAQQTLQQTAEACTLDPHITHPKPPPTYQYKTTPDTDSTDRLNIFATLLGLYLNPPAGEEKRWPQALDLLAKHGARLPASSTLELMPTDLAVGELSSYFRGRLRHATSTQREAQVVRSLEAVRRDDAEMKLVLGNDEGVGGRRQGRNRRVTIREEDHCRVCHKRFGASAVRVYPDNEVVHYGCVGRRGLEKREIGTGAGVGGVRGRVWG